MVSVEKTFPRGGLPASAAKPKESREDKIIFGVVQKKLKKPKTKTKKQVKSPLDADDKPDNIKTVSAELLNYETIQDDMLVMGIVKDVEQLALRISLPGRMQAQVSVLEISDAYTKATQEFLAQKLPAASYKPLQDLYKVGQIVYGRVLDVNRRENGRTHLAMSLKPSQVHSELAHLNVKQGFIFNGAVEEVQDHGYVIETGIKGLRAFLPLEHAVSQQRLHVVGELVYLKVKKITHDQAASTCSCQEVKASSLKVKNQLEPNIDYILPSSVVQFLVTKRLKDGLQGSIMNDAFTAYINEHQLAEPLASPDDYKPHAVLQARVLYVMPLTKLVYLSLNLHKTTAASESNGETATVASQPHFTRGDIIEDAKVHHMGTGGVILVLDGQHKGVISYRTIKTRYKGNYDQDELLAKYARNTQHKVRVLDYDPMDSLYICTDDAQTVHEKHFSLADLQAGEFVTAVIKSPNAKVGGYNVQVGKLRGIIEKLFLAPSTKPLERDTKVRCRVIAVAPERRTIYLTNRPEYMTKNCKVLTTITQAKPNTVYTGTVVKSEGNFVLVRFFNDLKGALHIKSSIQELASTAQPDATAAYYPGLTMQFRINDRNGEQLTLGLLDEAFNLGEICDAKVVNTLDSGLEISIDCTTTAENTDAQLEPLKALIPVRLLSDFEDLLLAKLRMYQAQTEIQAVCINRNIFSLRDVPYFQQRELSTWAAIKEGDILKAAVKNVSDDVVDLMVPIKNYGKLVRVHLQMFLVRAYKNANVVLVPEQVVYVKVLSKELNTKTITVTAKLTDVWDARLSSTAEYFGSYLDEVKQIKETLKAQKAPIARYSVGQKVTASFLRVDADSKGWLYTLDGGKQVLGIVPADGIGARAKPPAVGHQKECLILWVDYASGLVYLNNKAADMTHISADVEELPSNLVGKSGLNAKILLKLPQLFVCSLKKGPNPLVYCPMRLHYNDFENSIGINVREGDFCKLAFIHKTWPIAVLESTWKLWHDVERKRKAQQKLEALIPKAAKQPKLEQAGSNKQKQKTPKDNTLEPTTTTVAATALSNNKKLKHKLEAAMEAANNKPAKKSKSDAVPPIEPDELFFFVDKTPDHQAAAKAEVIELKAERAKRSITPKSAPQPQPAKSTLALPGINNFWTTDLTQLQTTENTAQSSDEDDDDDDADAANQAAQQKKKKLSATEKFKLQRDEESRLRAIEEKYADPKQLPETVDQFDRLVLAEPNDSKHWISYMAFHLQTAEIDKARAVARRAIKAISFRHNDDQLNIWLALLNLELRYGGKESYDATLKEALTYNDQLKVYLRTMEILREADKRVELQETIGIITKKFKTEPEAWKMAASAYFGMDMVERAQQQLHRALTCLPEREHVNTIVMFANLNHKYGHNEMAQTLLDQVVTSYPKRVDVWTQYVDMLVKAQLIDSARIILERAILQKIPLKKMRTIFKKYLEFEERFGTPADAEKVKKLAIEYVKTHANI